MFYTQFAMYDTKIFRHGSWFDENRLTFEMFSAWVEESKKLEVGEIAKEEYDTWRYNYPKFDTTQKWAKVPSQEFSDWLVKELDKE